MEDINKHFHFGAFIIIILIIAVVLFHGFTREGIILLISLSISLLKIYIELYSKESSHFNSSIM
jgi:hypothetical protein